MAEVRTSTRRRRESLWTAGLRAAGLSTLVNVVLYILARAGGYVQMSPSNEEPLMAIGFGSVVFASVAAALLGTGVFAVAHRHLGHPIAFMGVIGAVVLLVASFVPYMVAPGGIAGASPANCGVAAFLELMHGFTAVMTLGVLADWRARHDRTH